MNKKCLVLFSGTGSIEKVMEKHGWKCRGVDCNNYFKPYYNVDILTWDYKKALKDFIPQYIHASPVCKFFSTMRNQHFTHDKKDGFILFKKMLEIINYCKELNPHIKVTIENPVNKTTNGIDLEGYRKLKTSYCKYGYKYMKKTYFWYSGFDLKLKPVCCKKDCCELSKKTGRHPVIIGYKPPVKYTDEQMLDWKWFIILRKTIPEYSNYNNERYFRYRIPEGLVEDIHNCI